MCAPWDDREGLFRPGTDYLVARDSEEMKVQLRRLQDIGSEFAGVHGDHARPHGRSGLDELPEIEPAHTQRTRPGEPCEARLSSRSRPGSA